MFNIRQSSNSEEEYIAKVLAAFLKIRQQEEKSIALQIIGKQQNMEKQINSNLKQEQHKSKEKPIKTNKPQKTIENKGDKYSEYGIFQNGAYVCLKCQSKVKRTQDLLKHWTLQHGRQVIPRRKRNIINEDTQCIKKISQETYKLESQSDL